MAERLAFLESANRSGGKPSSEALAGDAARNYMIQQGGGA